MLTMNMVNENTCINSLLVNSRDNSQNEDNYDDIWDLKLWIKLFVSYFD